MNDEQMLRKALRYRWLIFWVLAIGYLFVYFHRVSSAVVAPELVKAFGISGAVLGILASAYFYPYACMQLPVGLLADSLGPRKTVTTFLLIACFGAILFGLSPNITVAIFARVLVGLGVAALFVPTMKILAEWFRVKEFATMTGILMAVGGIGWLSAATPLALLTTWLGWRMAFVLIGVITLVIAVLTWAFVRNRPEEMGWPRITETTEAAQAGVGLLEGIGIVLSRRHFWPLAFWFFFSYGTVIGFGGLWGGPYLMEIYGLSKPQAGNVLMMIAVGMIIGSPLLGWLSDKVFSARKPVMVGGAFIYFLSWLPLALKPGGLSVALLYLLSFLIGVFGSAIVIVAFTANKELFPKEIAGTSTGLVNIFPFAGGAVFPPVMGYIMDKVGRVGGAYPVEAYQRAFLFCLLAALAAFLSVCFMKETLKRG
ncbi:MAG: MFS transporter [Deltaproteobacteria bacterium]|nr:MAG: MFS transporter [Deltaproteobacteria bacterium]RLB01655.1 MAG: MFS transporter [Deltaproteobacteria bacterium]